MKKDKTIHFYLFLFIFIIVFILLIIPTSYAKDIAGKLIFAKGEVLFSLDQGKSWSRAKPLMEFSEGTYIKVGDDGQAALLLQDHSQIRLRAGSLLNLKQAGSEPNRISKKRGILSLILGKLWFRNKRRGLKPLFETPVVTASIRGTEMALSVYDNGDTDITVLEGQVKCANQFGESLIARGQAVEAKKGQAPNIMTIINPEDKVQWLLLTPEIKGPADEMPTKNQDIKAILIAEKAMQLLVTNEFNKALETAKQALQIAPNRACVHVAFATILQSHGEFEKAVVSAKKACELDPLSIPALVRVVELLLGLDRVKEAQNFIDKFKGRQDPRIDMLNGYMALIKNNSKQAEIFFNNAIEKKRDFASAYLGLGLALYNQKKKDQGLENMEKACLLDPLAAYPHNYLAKAQYELGERDEAEIELNRASVLDPYDPTPYMYLATIKADTHRPGQGIKALEKAISLNNNKLMTRSRYLLDQDRAAKNVSLAWSLSQMGLHEWANFKGNSAVWDDPTNSGAYLFRASESVGLKSIDPATLSDTKRAELLKPVNANTYTTYSDYQNLLEIPSLQGSVFGRLGTDETAQASANIRGGNNRAAFYVQGGYETTDGPKDNTGMSKADASFTLKTSIVPGHEILAEGRTVSREEDDLTPWQDSDIDPSNKDADYDLWTGSIGYHWHQGTGKDFIALVQSQDRDAEILSIIQSQYFLNPGITQFDRRNWDYDTLTWRAEAVEFFRIGDHRLTGGMAWNDAKDSYDFDWKIYFDPATIFGQSGQTSVSDFHKEELRFYARDIWNIFEDVNLDLGVSWVKLDDIWYNHDGEVENKEETLPHIGAMWNVTSKDMIRAGYFKEIQPNYLSATLAPTEMAGFKKVTGVISGTETWFYGLGWDRQWNSTIFTRAEIYHQDRRYPESFSSHPYGESWKDEKQNAFRIGFESLLTDQWALALSYRYIDHRTQGHERKRIDNEVDARLTWAHPSGWKAQTALWYVNQDEKTGYINPMDDDFIIASISVEKSLWNKKALIIFRWENIFDEEFRYLILEQADDVQLPWQGSFASIGLQFNF